MRRAYYQFVYHGSVYESDYRFGRLDPAFLERDSVLVVFPKNKPEKSVLKNVLYRPPKEMITVSKKDGQIIIPDYAIVHKPLFFSAQNPDENETEIQKYVYSKKHKQQIDGAGNMTVSVIFSETGNIEKVNILKSSENKSLDLFVTSTLLNAPQGKPGKNDKGELRKVSYIILFDFN